MKLHLNLKSEYFDQIKSKEKKYEYRLYTDHWISRLKAFSMEANYRDSIVLMKGYPKRGDKKRIIERPWRGYHIKTIIHKHFGSGTPVKVFAIKVNE